MLRKLILWCGCGLVLTIVTLVAGVPPRLQPADPTDDLRNHNIPKDAESIHKGLVAEVGSAYNDLDEIFIEGRHVGDRLYYKTEGGDRTTLAIERTYKDGKLHGYWKQYREDGSLAVEIPYRDGVVDGTITYFDESGKPLSRSRLIRGSGLWTSYDKWGKHKETPYRNGKIHGNVRSYGKVTDDGISGFRSDWYEDGRREGWSHTYAEDGTLLVESFSVHVRASGAKTHGVVRKWDKDGKVLDGYPTYWIEGRQVNRNEFRAAAKNDPLLQKTLRDEADD